MANKSNKKDKAGNKKTTKPAPKKESKCKTTTPKKTIPSVNFLSSKLKGKKVSKEFKKLIPHLEQGGKITRDGYPGASVRITFVKENIEDPGAGANVLDCISEKDLAKDDWKKIQLGSVSG